MLGLVVASLWLTACGAPPSSNNPADTSANNPADSLAEPLSAASLSGSLTTSSSGRGGGRQYDSVLESELGPIVKSHPLVLVEFGDDVSCYRCQQMTPVVNSVCADFADQAHVVRVPYAPASRMGKTLGLRVCPTYFVFKDGQIVDRVEGSVATPVLIAKLATWQAAPRRNGDGPTPTVPQSPDW